MQATGPGPQTYKFQGRFTDKGPSILHELLLSFLPTPMRLINTIYNLFRSADLKMYVDWIQRIHLPKTGKGQTVEMILHQHIIKAF